MIFGIRPSSSKEKFSAGEKIIFSKWAISVPAALFEIYFDRGIFNEADKASFPGDDNSIVLWKFGILFSCSTKEKLMEH